MLDSCVLSIVLVFVKLTGAVICVCGLEKILFAVERIINKSEDYEFEDE